MFTPSHRESLARDGYAVVSGLVPDPLVNAARDFICSYLGVDLQRPETWYCHEPLEERFPSASMLFCGGSVVRGVGYPVV